MELRIDIDFETLVKIVGSEQLPFDEPVQTVFNTIIEEYTPLVKSFEKFRQKWVNDAVGDIPPKESLTSRNFGDRTAYKRMQVTALYEGWIGSQKHWHEKRMINEAFRSGFYTVVEYLISLYPGTYLYTYEINDPDISSLDYIIGLTLGQPDESSVPPPRTL